MARKGAGGTPATVALTRAGVPFTVRPYEHDPRAESFGLEAAEALGVPPERVFKTLLAEAAGRLVVGIVPVTGQLDLKALARAVGAPRAVMADPAAAVLYVNFDAGGDDGWLVDLVARFDSKEATENLKPFEAFGISSWIDGDETHALLRLTTED